MQRLNTVYVGLLIMLLILLNVESGLAQPQEATFNFTGVPQSFVVPPSVFSIHVQAWGAKGANAIFLDEIGLGGLGGYAEGDLAVIPGQILQIFVGGEGSTIIDGFGGGGFNGGGDANTFNFGFPIDRAGGGGASDVRVGGTTLNNRVIVAAGGGGACDSIINTGGAGGGLTGQPGGSTLAGGGGTQTIGGAGFNHTDGCLNGEFGIGGSSIQSTICSGGGGGWYGGGAGCGGGGGSSYIGGVENGNTTPGLRDGDGLIILTFTPVVRNIPTLSEWGLIAMASILGIVGLFAIRKRVVV